MPRSECQTGLWFDVGPEALFLQSLQSDLRLFFLHHEPGLVQSQLGSSGDAKLR